MLNWCIIGSGDVVSRLLQKSLNYQKISKVTSILSDDLLQAKIVANKLGIKKIYLNTKNNIKKIQNDKNINSIYIATPPNFHFFYIKTFCRFKKNIICEKPLVKNLSELKKLILVKKKYKFNLLTCFYRRHLDRFKYIKKILKKNIIGRIVYFDIRFFHNQNNHPTAKIKQQIIPWRFKKRISGGGNIMDMGIHSLDLVEFLIDEIKSVTGFNSNIKRIYDVEETSIINLQLKNGIIGQGSWCSLSPKKEDFFKIYGLEGYIKFSTNFGEDEYLYIYKNSIVKKIRLPYNQPLHKNMMRDFIKILNKLNNSGNYFVSNNGFKTIEILGKIIRL